MKASSNNESGNMLFIILIAVVLIGALTAAVTNSGDAENSSIDDETLAINVSEVQRYGAELERAITYIMQNGYSEVDIRFAHPNAPSAYGDLSADTDKGDQVFHSDGGGAQYRDVPDGLNDGSVWQFYGGTDLPSVGSDRADLIMVLPNVTLQFCNKINSMNGQMGTPTDTASCLWTDSTDIFNGTTQFDSTPNTVDEATFTQDAASSAAKPASQACVVCGANRHFYQVIMAR
ncbi:hypothetical protein N9Z27_01210 [Alphaproteobacteria bacterium]|nr:hypothetical protein [Alphaproteobacteria bacterium]